MILPAFNSRDELFKHLKANKNQIIAEKKFEIKKADSVCGVLSYHHNMHADKSIDNNLLSKDKIKVKAIVNTTNLLDSHGDVHINGLWKKSIKEQKNLYHIQEHKMNFDHIISDNVVASSKIMTWRELGYDMDGTTEALIFDSEIEKTRNPYMFTQYAKGHVKNHSVGMQYVQLQLCINSSDDDYKEEKANWDKYIGYVANNKEAEQSGYFWAVTEAKIIEGSAVVRGSNWVTPTQSVETIEPSEDTQKTIEEPARPLSFLESLGSKI